MSLTLIIDCLGLSDWMEMKAILKGLLLIQTELLALVKVVKTNVHQSATVKGKLSIQNVFNAEQLKTSKKMVPVLRSSAMKMNN